MKKSHSEKSKRNQQIRKLLASGKSQAGVAREFNITPQRLGQLVQKWMWQGLLDRSRGETCAHRESEKPTTGFLYKRSRSISFFDSFEQFLAQIARSTVFQNPAVGRKVLLVNSSEHTPFCFGSYDSMMRKRNITKKINPAGICFEDQFFRVNFEKQAFLEKTLDFPATVNK